MFFVRHFNYFLEKKQERSNHKADNPASERLMQDELFITFILKSCRGLSCLANTT